MIKNLRRRVCNAGTSGLIILLGAISPARAGEAMAAGNSDWPQSAFNASHTGFNRFETTITHKNVSHLTEVWKAAVGGGIFASPVVSDGRLFIGGGDGHMYAFNASTGESLWVGPHQPLFFVDSAAAGQGLVFASSVFQTFLAYRASSGEIAWTSDLTDVRASPTLAGRKLYVASFDGTLSALDTRTGNTMWSTPGTCCVFDQSPVVDGGRVFQIRTDGTLTAYEANSGTQLWTTSQFAVGTFAAGSGKLFLNHFPNVIALSQTTGEQVWAAPVLTQAEPSAPVVAGGLVYVTDSLLWALDAKTGATVWSAAAKSNWGPTVANGVVYASNQNGEWDAFDARDGTLLWSVVIDGGCFFSCANAVPVIANGTLYLAGPDDFVHAYRPSE